MAPPQENQELVPSLQHSRVKIQQRGSDTLQLPKGDRYETQPESEAEAANA